MTASEIIPKPLEQRSTKRILMRIAVILLILTIAIVATFKFSPWPSALLVRYVFNKEAVKVNEALKKHVPKRISQLLNRQYDVSDKDALLDVYYPSSVSNTEQRLPVIVWIHGGGFISGNKGQIASYCKLLASKGYTTVSVDYSIAPERSYPVPLKQINLALAYLKNNSEQLHINNTMFILAADSEDRPEENTSKLQS